MPLINHEMSNYLTLKLTRVCNFREFSDAPDFLLSSEEMSRENWSCNTEWRLGPNSVLPDIEAGDAKTDVFKEEEAATDDDDKEDDSFRTAKIWPIVGKKNRDNKTKNNMKINRRGSTCGIKPIKSKAGISFFLQRITCFFRIFSPFC